MVTIDCTIYDHYYQGRAKCFVLAPLFELDFQIKMGHDCLTQ
jgi:hypothetical protein